MAEDKVFSDDYIAQLLAADAQRLSKQYASMGTSAYTPSKLPANKPKPNTRFLQNLVKETTSHNQALLAKEAHSSRARLDRLQELDMHRGLDIRKRQLGIITSTLTSTKRDDILKNERSARTGRDSKEGKYERRSRSERHRVEDDDERCTRKERKERHSRGRLSRSPSPATHSDNKRKHRRRSRERSDSPRRTHTHSPSSRYRHRSRYRRRSKSPRRDTDRDTRTKDRSKRHTRDKEERDPYTRPTNSPPKRKSKDRLREEEDSDPLEDIIGPLPPPITIPRGRGTTTTSSGIDSRFANSYDPKHDVTLNSDEEDDWDQALEALRDRQKWQATQGDRLRAAGFGEDEIAKWEKGGQEKEKRPEDFVYAKRGEDREWDRGKTGNIFEQGEESSALSLKGRDAIFDIDDIKIVVRKRTPSVDLEFGRLR